MTASSVHLQCSLVTLAMWLAQCFGCLLHAMSLRVCGKANYNLSEPFMLCRSCNQHNGNLDYIHAGLASGLFLPTYVCMYVCSLSV